MTFRLLTYGTPFSPTQGQFEIVLPMITQLTALAAAKQKEKKPQATSGKNP
ncbi:MAG: hypothetical protein KZQ73_16105 [Candidatus Thiodiazotropha sp. (ex Semelilucina semeliformis)]|nr:hypothetical protein [Candidatus Thiodiazotropha sp. (ex Myrtea spinifera)]MCU7809372.1 hypothetical protein [Candidatus Thiodiazotropha sp. (ex Semelilucina semeliformis)]MCU7827531.1 hypothetical protein [Candidatus Thiodiazotropha sp. (ex Myrtea sp. 'scaly one' KF741663)]